MPMRSMMLGLVVFIWPSWALAHPVAKDSHDRTITVRLARGTSPGQLVVVVDYRLEVDEATAVFEDLKPFLGEIDLTKFQGKPLELYAEYARLYAPILAGNLRVKLNGRSLPLLCVKKTQTLKDEQGENLGHLRCDFNFQTQGDLVPGQENLVEFREGNYLLQEGRVDLAATVEGGWRIVSLIAPDDELKKRAVQDQKPGDDDRLREVRARFVSPHLTDKATTPETKGEPPPSAPTPPAKLADDHTGLKTLLLDYLVRGERSFWIILGLAALFGAIHALTPGHGKTLVAAYLVGQRGTVWHALMLGFVTTLTHTGAVLILALILGALSHDLQQSLQGPIQAGIGLALGLLIVCLGFWLLLQRLSGRADHFHLGGGHPHHGPTHHEHLPPTTDRVTWGGLILLGITGGLIPCWDAVILLIATIAAGLFWLAFPLVAAFSAGLAATLVLVGISVVKVRAFAESRWGEGRFVKALPILSALIVTAMGFWLCYDSVHGK